MLDYQSGNDVPHAIPAGGPRRPDGADCGRCDVCAGAWYPTDVPDGAAQAAGRTLRKVGVEIDARSQWPSGMSRLGVSVSGKLSADDRVEPGRAVARLTDLGWGQRLRSLLAASAADAPADERLLRGLHRGARRLALGAATRGRRRRTFPAPSAARRLGGPPPRHARPVAVPRFARARPPTRARGEPGGNSAFRLASVYERFRVPADLADQLAGLTGPVLLVDDLVDSRWTVTVAGRVLRQAGAPGCAAVRARGRRLTGRLGWAAAQSVAGSPEILAISSTWDRNSASRASGVSQSRWP